MKRSETISEILVTDDGEVQVHLESGGEPDYQMIYRAAAGVYWNNELGCFTFTPKQWDVVQSFSHIISVIKNETSIEMNFGKDVLWSGVTDSAKREILDTHKC